MNSKFIDSMSPMSDVSIAERAGYAKESGVVGERKKIVVIFR